MRLRNLTCIKKCIFSLYYNDVDGEFTLLYFSHNSQKCFTSVASVPDLGCHSNFHPFIQTIERRRLGAQNYYMSANTSAGATNLGDPTGATLARRSTTKRSSPSRSWPRGCPNASSNRPYRAPPLADGTARWFIGSRDRSDATAHQTWLATRLPSSAHR